MSARVIRRPWGGWNARIWRREVIGWLQLAMVFLCFWGTGNILLAMVESVADLLGG